MKLKELARIIDWILYLLLCIIAIYFIIKSDVIQKYLNKNTDSYETTIESDKYVAPDFTFCDHSRRIMKLENQMDLKLSIRNPGHDGEVYDSLIDNFTKYPFHEGQCIVMDLSNLNLTYNKWLAINIRFNSSIQISNLPQISGYVSSRNNPPFAGSRHDGMALGKLIQPQQKVIFKLEEEETDFISENCRTQPFLEYLADKFKKDNINCPVKCWPKKYRYVSKEFDDSLKMYPKCESEKIDFCIEQWILEVGKNSKVFCNQVSYMGPTIFVKIRGNESWCSKVRHLQFQIFQSNNIKKF